MNVEISDHLGISDSFAELIVQTAKEAGELTDDTDFWFENRLKPNLIHIGEPAYSNLCVTALKYLLTDPDFSSRDDDLSLIQQWTDLTHQLMGEYAFKLFVAQNWAKEVVMGHEVGELDTFLATDVHGVVEDGVKRLPNLNISIKTSKWNGIWLDIPGDQFNHADIHVFVKVGTGRDHLFAFFKHISVFKHKVLKKGVEVGSLTDQESEDLFDALPSFAPIPAYICGFVKQAETYQPLPYSGKKGRIHYTISGWNGEILAGDLDRIKTKESVEGNIKFKGIGSFSHDKGYLFNTGNLLWERGEWSNIIDTL